MLMTILLALAGLLAILLIYAATRPGSFRVERTIGIQAPPSRIAPLIDDFHRWESWSPWEKLDPAMTKTFSGAAAGPGAVYEWSGNSKAGAGRMEVTGSTPTSVAIKLDFLKPFEGHNVADFTLVPNGAATDVHWVMSGQSTYMIKLMGIFVSMDKMMGPDFEEGLANMKRVAEA